MPVQFGWRANDGGDTRVVAGENELGYGAYIEGGVLHIDEDGVDAGHLAHHGDFIARDEFYGHEWCNLAVEDSSPEGVVDIER